MTNSELVEQLEKAIGPSRELDIEVAWNCLAEDWTSGDTKAVQEPFSHIKTLPQYTRSLDSALSLCEKLLGPAKTIDCLDEARRSLGRDHALHCRFWKEVDGPLIPALACYVVAATIKVLIIKESEKKM